MKGRSDTLADDTPRRLLSYVLTGVWTDDSILLLGKRPRKRKKKMKAYRREGNYRLYITGTDYMKEGYRWCEVWLGELNNALGCEHLEGTFIKDFNVPTYRVVEEFERIVNNHMAGLYDNNNQTNAKVGA